MVEHPPDDRLEEFGWRSAMTTNILSNGLIDLQQHGF